MPRPRSAGREAPADAAAAPGTGAEPSTRDRILDVALDLFIERGVDKTSLREIAERMGFSKAAIYYHFASKDDILMALHMRLHEFGHRAMDRLDAAPPGLDSWAAVTADMVDEILANRRIFLFHQRNATALQSLHQANSHVEEHDDLEERLQSVIADSSLPLRDRVRLAAALATVMAGLMLSAKLLSDVPTEEIAPVLREAIWDLLGTGEHSRQRGD